MVAVSTAYTSEAQQSEKMNYESVVAGAIIKDGKEIPGYIGMMGTTSVGTETTRYPAPWEFQSKIRFIEKQKFDQAEKIKNKDYEKLEPGDIDGYRYYGRDTLIYESVKYADMSAVGMNMLAKKMFMRKVLDGKITLFHHFQTPLMIGEVSSIRNDVIEYANPNVVYRQNADGKLKLLNSLNVKKELTDCPVVVAKYENNEYKVVGNEDNNSNSNNFLNKTLLRDGVRLLVVEDYNKTCK